MILSKRYCVFLSFMEKETLSEMFWLTHCRFGLFVVFLTFRVNFYNKKPYWCCSSRLGLFTACCALQRSLQEGSCSLLFEASWDRQRLNDLTKVAESLSTAHAFDAQSTKRLDSADSFCCPFSSGLERLHC